jgi:DNA-binding transcriptional MocR family regulator
VTRLDEGGIRQSLNVLARKNGAYLLEYGHPFGYLPLREHLALTLAETHLQRSIPASQLLGVLQYSSRIFVFSSFPVAV